MNASGDDCTQLEGVKNVSDVFVDVQYCTVVDSVNRTGVIHVPYICA